MTMSALELPECSGCGAPVGAPGEVCHACAVVGTTTSVNAPGGANRVGPQVAAVVLSLVWLGGGHLYAGRTGPAVAWAVVELALVLVAVAGAGWPVALPIWLVGLVTAMVTSASAVRDADRRRRSAVRR